MWQGSQAWFEFELCKLPLGSKQYQHRTQQSYMQPSNKTTRQLIYLNLTSRLYIIKLATFFVSSAYIFNCLKRTVYHVKFFHLKANLTKSTTSLELNKGIKKFILYNIILYISTVFFINYRTFQMDQNVENGGNNGVPDLVQNVSVY
jgi:hypothetical protein